MDRRAYLRAMGGGVAVLSGCAGREPDRPDAESTTDRSNPSRVEPPGPESTTGRSSTDRSTIHEDYRTTTVRVLTPGGETLGSVTAAIADTGVLRYRGLSDTETLPADRGMLFVFESVDERSFVMRRMDFGIDIVYADGDGTITTIHHAPAPAPNEDGGDQAYPGRGQYVLEVVYGWTTDRGIGVGDRLAFELPG